MGYLRNWGLPVSKSACAAFSAVLLVPAIVTVARPAARLASADRHVLCWYAGRPVYVREATGRGYARGLAEFRRAYRKWGAGAGTEYSLISPLIAEIKPPHHNWPTKMYTACLDGVLARYARYRVVAAVEARWHPKLGRFVDLGRMGNALGRQAFLLHKGSAILDRALIKGWSASQFCEAYRAAFPRLGSTAFIRRYYWRDYYMATPALYVAINKAFPEWRTKLRKPSGWQRYDFDAGLEQLCVGAIVQENRSFFLRLAAERYGSWHFIIGIRAEGGKAALDAIRDVTASLGGARGPIPPMTLVHAAPILSLLGSPTKFALFSGGRGYISALSGLRPAAITPGIFLRAMCPPNDRPGYIYIYDPTPVRKLGKTKGGAPVSLVYAAAENYVVRPAIREVLLKLRPGPGLHPPSAKWLRENMWIPSIFPNVAGTPVPRVIIKTPWPKSDASLYSGQQ